MSQMGFAVGTRTNGPQRARKHRCEDEAHPAPNIAQARPETRRRAHRQPDGDGTRIIETQGRRNLGRADESDQLAGPFPPRREESRLPQRATLRAIRSNSLQFENRAALRRAAASPPAKKPNDPAPRPPFARKSRASRRTFSPVPMPVWSVPTELSPAFGVRQHPCCAFGAAFGCGRVAIDRVPARCKSSMQGCATVPRRQRKSKNLARNQADAGVCIAEQPRINYLTGRTIEAAFLV